MAMGLSRIAFAGLEGGNFLAFAEEKVYVIVTIDEAHFLVSI